MYCFVITLDNVERTQFFFFCFYFQNDNCLLRFKTQAWKESEYLLLILMETNDFSKEMEKLLENEDWSSSNVTKKQRGNEKCMRLK